MQRFNSPTATRTQSVQHRKYKYDLPILDDFSYVVRKDQAEIMPDGGFARGVAQSADGRSFRRPAKSPHAAGLS